MLKQIKKIIHVQNHPSLIIDQSSGSIIDANGAFMEAYPDYLSGSIKDFPENLWERVSIEDLTLLIHKGKALPPKIEENKVSSQLEEENKKLKSEAFVHRVQLENYDFVTRVIGTLKDFLFVVSPDGLILHINEAAEEFLDIRSGSALGLKFETFFFDPKRLQEAIHSKIFWDAEEAVLVNAKKVEIPVLMNSAPLVTSAKKFSGFVFLAKDVTFFKKILSDLNQEKMNAQQANVAKSQFLSNMSHELRTPLNAIIGYSELVLEEAEDGFFDDVIRHVPHIKDSGTYLLELINNILDIARIESGRSDVNIGVVDLDQIVREIRSIVEPLASKTKNILTFINRDQVKTIESDPRRLKQILVNLISNALKFTSEGQVKIEFTKEAKQLGIAVIDNGIGIAEDKLDKIFEKFTQVHNINEEALSGSGLGLSIVTSLLELLKGKITVSSKFGEGTRFDVSIPLRWYSGRAPARTAEIIHQPPSENRILIVDDDSDIREYIRCILQEQSYTVVEAENVGEAIEILKSGLAIKGILTDLHMPQVSGIELIKFVHSNCPQIPIAVVSGTTLDTLINKCSNYHIKLLIKPFQETQLVELMKELILEESPKEDLVS